MNTPFLKAMFAILAKDLRAEARSREQLGAMLLFSVLSVLIFSFALELNRVARLESISGVLWVTVVFASVLGLNRSMALEREYGNIDALLLSPISRNAIFAGKFLGNMLFALVVGLLLLPMMIVLYNLPIGSAWLLIFFLLVIGTWGICLTGTMLASMTVQARGGEALLPIALLPVALPILLAAVRATTSILNNGAVDDWGIWVGVILSIDVFYSVVCFGVFHYVVEE
jgi:heme exporter protein B